MGGKTGIEWTDSTWNPTVGCTKVSPGCDHCYAETLVNRFAGSKGFPNRFEDMLLRGNPMLTQPLRWTKPRRIFVNSLSDLFHEDVPRDYIVSVFAVMRRATQHQFQLLTKRPGRMRSLLSDPTFRQAVIYEVQWRTQPLAWNDVWPLPNVWLGVSVEDQKWANVRVPVLLDTPAAVRFVSAEPLLGPVDFTDCAGISAVSKDWVGGPTGGTGAPHPLLDWVIVGGESGPGSRPMDPQWAADIRDQCQWEPVAFLFKQWGDFDVAGLRVGKKIAGRELDGVTHDGYPVSS